MGKLYLNKAVKKIPWAKKKKTKNKTLGPDNSSELSW